ncbi:FecCD family ABC transporter permease [Rhizobium sp. SL42]|uniref:FecCD family ABC transporter permease n=1 Tax=Rhizobium sp. SL42 TaxID=2806346 RepID=UPI001F1634A8|nr:iron ABC transporter permease [Rhizobium sp. SL42]UJW73794.1 iron ABC transporter permease [Rhizobium sp. SL42]
MSDGQVVLRVNRFSLRLVHRSLLTNGVLALLLSLLVGFALGSGSLNVSPAVITDWLLQRDVGWTETTVLEILRAPRILLAATCGGMLALAGAVTQHVTRNGLADPGLIGVKAGASLCIVALLLTWPEAPLALRPIVGLAGGLAAGLSVAFLARGASPLKFIMIGVGCSWCLSSMLVVLLTAADIRSLQRAMIWLAGSLEGANWPSVYLASAILACLAAIILSLARHAELADMGAAKASTLGVNIKGVRATCLIATVLLVAGAVSVAGGLGFVGLIAPHLTRLLPRQGLRGHLISSTLIGGLLVLAADLLGAGLFAPIRLPVGVTLAMIGAPLLVLLLWLRRNRI